MDNKGNSRRCPHCGFNEHKYQQHPLHLEPRTILQNQYIIGITLGQGGFGTTYLGLDQRLQKKVAIKEYLPATLATRDVITATVIPLQEYTFSKGLKLFIDEARHLAKFDHPNIVRVINFFEANQTGYMVMDYLEGLNPEAIINQVGGILPVKEALDIILPLLDALAAIHAQHIYHRDISIQNVRILNSGIPVLIDFGAARYVVGEQSRTLDLVLKHGYSPLEQYSGKGKIGPWTDIYACGALLYLMITGKLPAAATDRFCEDNLVAPIEMAIDISQSLSDTIMQALAIRHEERFQTVAEFKAALQGFTPKVLAKKPNSTNLIIFMLVIIGIIYLDYSYLNDPIKHLLEKAKIQWDSEKILTPNNDNVYATYKQILQLKPDDLTANNGINKIAEYYYNLAKTATENDNLTRALELIQQGLRIKSDHVNLLNFQQQLKKVMLQQQQAEKIQKLLIKAGKNLTQLQLEIAIADYKNILILEPDNKLAKTGLTKIADKYLQLAQTQNSLYLANKGLRNFPTHAGLLAIKQKLLAQQATQQHEAEKTRKIKQLLKQAELQLANLQLTLPPNNNAYATYQQILKLEPNNLPAQAGLVQIADKYLQLANTNNLTKNLELVEKGLKVLPNHFGLIALRDNIIQKMQPVPEVIPLKSLVLKEKSVIPPPPKIEPIKPVNEIENLLTLAHQQFELAQFELAYQTYKQILTVDLDNLLAIAGLEKITSHYIELANAKYQQGKLTESMELVQKGLATDPKNSTLLALQKEILRLLQQDLTKPEVEPNTIILTPSF